MKGEPRKFYKGYNETPTMIGIPMQNANNVDAQEDFNLGKVVAKSLVEGTVITAVSAAGLLAVGLTAMKIQELRKKRNAKKIAN